MVASTSVPVFTRIALALSCAVIVSNKVLSSPRADSALRNRTKAVRSGVATSGEPTKPPERGAVVQRLGKFDVGKVVPDSQQHGLE